MSMTEAELLQRRYTDGSAMVVTQGLWAETERQARVAPNDGPVQYPGQSHTEKKKEKSKYKETNEKSYAKMQKTAGSRFVQPDELSTHWMHEHVLSKKKSIPTTDGKSVERSQEWILSRVLEGDYSNLQQLDPVLRSAAAGKYMERLNANFVSDGTPEALVNGLFKLGGVSQLMNPLFRLGVSVLMKSTANMPSIYKSTDKAFWAEVEDLCNQRIMSATIYTAPEADGNEIDAAMVQRNRQSQIFLAKTLLAAHLGRLQKTTTTGKWWHKEKHSEDWSGSMASAFAHCSRVGFSLPGDMKTMESMIGRDTGAQHGFEKRTAATHNLRRKRRANGGKSFKEIKNSILNTTFKGQYGMNVAVGGLGNEGIPGPQGARKLKNDGSCGHCYMHVSKPEEDKFGGLLIGFESDAPGVMNMTGHKHDWKASPEFASSFGGMRCDEIGDKYGGRYVDLSGIDSGTFEILMTRLESYMNTRMDLAERGGPQGEQAQAELMNLADKLSGKMLSRQQIDDLFN
ncbi:MAG: hypothetical protein IK115_03500 [Lachnospiraceae bacterium]|nr:hypothetical protein [Lachnospiraceae bacterium]